MPDRTGLPRRAVLPALVALSALAACGTRPHTPAAALTIACGEPGGFYRQFGDLLAKRLVTDGVAGAAHPIVTAGSFDNLDRLGHGRAMLALSQLDAAREAATGAAALGRVYANYLHCAVRRDSRARRLADLAGAAVSLGPPGAGVALTAERVLAAAGLDASAGFTPQRLDLSSAVAALEHREIGALMWSGGLPTGPLLELDRRIGLRLLDLADAAAALRSRFGPLHESAVIPAQAYPGSPRVTTVAVANLLLCRPDLPDGLASDIVGVLVRDAADLIPNPALGIQFLDPNTLIGTFPVRLHPGAAARYRRIHG